jgi:hypothetical protein
MFLVRGEALEKQPLQSHHQGPKALGTGVDHQMGNRLV